MGRENAPWWKGPHTKEGHIAWIGVFLLFALVQLALDLGGAAAFGCAIGMAIRMKWKT